MSGAGGSVSDNMRPMKKIKGQDHMLAYITPGEAKTLENLGGQKTMTPEGIPAYPPPGPGGQGPGGSGQDSGGQGPQGGRNNEIPDRNRGQQYSAPKPKSKTPTRTGGPPGGGDPRMYSPPKDRTSARELAAQRARQQKVKAEAAAKAKAFREQQEKERKERERKQNPFYQVVDFYSKGGFLGAALRGLSGVSSDIQKKAMTFSLNKKISDLSNRADFHPGAYGYKIQDIQKDIAAIERGEFGQNDYTKKYGSGDATNPLDASFNPNALTDSERDNLSDLFRSETIFAKAKTKPIESVAAKWYKNLGNIKNNFAYQSAYASAKAKQQGILGSPSPFRYLAVNESPFYNWLKDNSLDKGIL